MRKQDIVKLLPLETERTIIRQPTTADIDAIQTAKEERDEDCRRWMSFGTDEGMSRAGAEEWINLQTEENTHIGLIALDKKTGDYIMSSGLDGEDPDFSLISTGFWTSKRYEGKSYAFEVMTALFVFAFETVKAERIEMQFYEGNTRSRNLMERLGMTHDKTEPKAHTSRLTGELLDLYQYSITNQKLSS